MAERYSYEDIEFTDADPSLVLPKPKAESKPRVPLPAALTDALRESATYSESDDAASAVRAVVVAGPEKAAKNLVSRMRSWVAKELDAGKSVKAAVTPNGDVQGAGEPDSWKVTFAVVAKRQVNRKKSEASAEPSEEGQEDTASETPKPKRARKSS